MKATLSPPIQRLFWDTRADALDIQTDAKVVIERVLNLGTLADWRWLLGTYGRAEIWKYLMATSPFGRDNIRPESRRVATLLLK